MNYQVQVNTKYNKSIYIGYILGLLINCSFCVNNGISYYIFMSFSFLLCATNIYFFCKFKDPEFINELNDEELGNNNELEMKRTETDDEKIQFEIKSESIENIEKDEENNEDLLSNLKKEQKNSLLKYYKLILIIVLFVLFTSQYISENLLLFLPLLIDRNLITYFDKINININIIIYPIISSIIFILSLFLQNQYLRKSHFQKNIKILLIIFSFLMILFSLCFLSLCIKIINAPIPPLILIIIIEFSFFIMILFNELYRVITINLFIRLLPSNKIGNLDASTLINIVSKIGRIAPSLIILIYYSFFEKNQKYITLNKDLKIDEGINIGKTIIFGLQSLFMLINFILFLCFFSYIKNRSINRILYL